MAARSLQTLVLLLACAAPLALASECGVGSPTKASCATLYPWGTLCCSQYGWCGETTGALRCQLSTRYVWTFQVPTARIQICGQAGELVLQLVCLAVTA
jgi:hypothetical protein